MIYNSILLFIKIILYSIITILVLLMNSELYGFYIIMYAEDVNFISFPQESTML